MILETSAIHLKRELCLPLSLFVKDHVYCNLVGINSNLACSQQMHGTIFLQYLIRPKRHECYLDGKK